MKRSMATLLLIGYILLVPFCFFGVPMMTSFDGATMSHATRSMSNCDMVAGCMGHHDTNNAIAHHGSMYFSLTSSVESPANFPLSLLIALFVITIFAEWSKLVSGRRKIRFIEGRQASTIARSDFLRWLAQKENSPGFA